MKEICHKKLSRLVGIKGTIPISSDHLEELVNASIEPDNLNKKKIAENLFENLSVPFEWLIDHTIRAKTMALQSIRNSHKAKKDGKEEWVRYLGWGFHFITDWATPYHSPTSKSNPVPALTGLGALFGGVLGGLSEVSKKGKTDKKDILKGVAKGSLLGAGRMGAAGAVKLSIEHTEFESECENRWKSMDLDDFHSPFEKETITLSPSQSWDNKAEIFKNLMKKVRNRANNLPSDWVFKCSDKEFVEYMVAIAKVMDLAVQMVIR